MIKRYKVKEVVKMEQGVRFFNDISYDLGLYFYPLEVMFAIGLACVGTMAKTGINELVPLVFGSMLTLGSGSCIAGLLSAEKISDKLRGKLNKIYDLMGDDFLRELKSQLELENKNISG